jgi:hypothetical protein
MLNILPIIAHVVIEVVNNTAHTKTHESMEI